MALQIVFDSAYGVSVPKAYARINRIELIRPIGSVVSLNVNYEIYFNEAARRALKSPITALSILVVPKTARYDSQGAFDHWEDTPNFAAYFDLASQNNMNPVRAAYLYMKTLPDFAAAVDV